MAERNKILVIEDTTEVRENICEILELDGYDVSDAKNGKEGVALALESNPDLILCDVMMPELDGFGVLKILSKNPKTNKIPFIFLTAKAEKADFRKGMGLGADDYITKPFDDTELLEAIEMRLRKSAHFEKISTADTNPESFFSELKVEKALESLSDEREVRTYKKKDVIYQEGQYPRWLFHIKKGEVKVYKTNEFGKVFISRVFSEGDYFGYHALLNDTTYQHTAETINDVELNLIPEKDFKLLIYNERALASHFIKLISNSAEQMESELIELAYSSVRRKVANALLAFTTQFSKENKLTFQVSREDLAAKAGTAKETLIRTLSEFKSEGMIKVEGQSISVLDMQALESIPQ